jgi:hypothetical protein
MIVLSKKKNIVDLLRNNIVYFSRMFWTNRKVTLKSQW